MKSKIEHLTLGFIVRRKIMIKANSNIYTFGKDLQERPILIISLKSKISISELEEFFELVAVMILLTWMKGCIPIYMEQLTLLIDLKSSNCSVSC